jgi:hypothetical protein
MPTLERIAFRTAMRQAAVDLAQSFADSNSDPEIWGDSLRKLQVYPGRPASLYPPTAFVNRIRERIDPWGPARMQRHPVVDLVFVHAVFDSADAVEHGDRFVDAFLAFVADNPHAAGGNGTLSIVETTDDPNFVPDWIPPDVRRTYYATIFALEGLALS